MRPRRAAFGFGDVRFFIKSEGTVAVDGIFIHQKRKLCLNPRTNITYIGPWHDPSISPSLFLALLDTSVLYVAGTKHNPDFEEVSVS